MTASDFLRLLLVRLWSGRPINVEATRQTDGAEPDSEGGDSSPAAAEVRLLPWDLGSYHRCHADQPHQLEERVGMVGREGGSTPQIAKVRVRGEGLHQRTLHRARTESQTPKPYTFLRAHEVLFATQGRSPTS